jgi:branched-chain amino acid transport system permease protein
MGALRARFERTVEGAAGWRRTGRRPALLALGALGLAPLVVGDEYVLNLMIVSLLAGAQAVAFDFTAGLIGVVNFGFAAFAGLGGYISALAVIRLGLSPWLGMTLGAVAAAVVGGLTGLLTLRLRGIFATVMSWFVGLALAEVATALVPLTRGSLGLAVPALFDTGERLPYYYALLPIAAASYALLSALAGSRLGLAFRALGDNFDAARASGVSPWRYRTLSFTLSCAVAGLLGGFHAHFVGILTPEVMSSRHSVEVLALAYVGGRGSLWGGALAAFLIIPVFEYLQPLAELRLVIYGALLIAVMIYAPGGIAGWVRERLARRGTAPTP